MLLIKFYFVPDFYILEIVTKIELLTWYDHARGGGLPLQCRLAFGAFSSTFLTKDQQQSF